MSKGLAEKKHTDNVSTLYECLSVFKGKGMAKTFWLTGKDGFNKPLPEPPPLDRYNFRNFSNKYHANL